MFDATSPRVHAYARRHVGPDLCEDIVSETYLTAWRRRDELPDAALPWLLVIARHTIANRTRGRRRADRLWQRAVEQLWHDPAVGDPADLLSDRARLDAAARADARRAGSRLILTPVKHLP